MGLHRFYLLLACFVVAAAQKAGRGFIGVLDHDSDSVYVDKIALDTLQSGITTIFLPLVYIIVFIIGLPSNAMAIWVLLFRSKKIHPASIYMANLALADLLFAIWIPLKIAYHVNGNNWTYGEGMCKVLVGFFYGNMYCSILFIACLSVQRYWVVAHPLTQQRTNNKLAIIVSLAVWAFIWSSSTPLYLYQQTARISDLNITTCHDVNVISLLKKNTDDSIFEDVKMPYYYFMVMAGLAFFAPCVVIVVAYVLMLRKLGNTNMDGKSSSKNRHRAILLIVTVLIAFLVCFIPSNLMLVVHYSLLSKGATNNLYSFYITTLCLASFNSCLDPFIYYYVSDEFREHVKNTLLCRSSRTVERMRVSFSSMKYSKKSNIYTSSSGHTDSSTC